MTFMVLAGAAMLTVSICRSVMLYGKAGQNLEYILEENESMRIKDSEIADFKRMEGVRAVSRQSESLLTVHQGEEPESLACVGLSGEYLAALYGGNEGGFQPETAAHSAAKVFYVNRQAYEMLMQAEGESAGINKQYLDGTRQGGTLQDKIYHIEYSFGEDAKTYYGKMILMENGPKQEEPCAFFQMDSASLKKNAGGVRICMKGDSLAGETKNKFMQKGYSISNLAAVNERGYQYEMELLHIKYGILTAVLCFAVSFSQLILNKNSFRHP